MNQMPLDRVNRREALGAGVAALTGAIFGRESSAVAQSQRNYFSFNLANKHPTGYGIDPSVVPAIYRSVADWLGTALIESRGNLNCKDKGSTYQLYLKPNEEREAIDTARTITRDIWRERSIAKSSSPKSEPSAGEIKASVDHMLSLRSRYAHTPIGMSVYACDNERRGLSFGTQAEMKFWNKANTFHGLPGAAGPIREQGKFLELVRTTAPSKTKAGDLLFSVGFNGHGASGGEGMSMLSNGAGSLSGALMTGASIAKALEEHCHNNRDLYLRQAKSDNCAYIGVFIFCCFSQDQVRNNSKGRDAGNSNDLLSRMENLTAQHRVRFNVFTESETMKPGFYQPGTVIPALGPRALARATDNKKGNLEIGDIYDSIGSGGDGVGSNPTLFVTDRKRPFMFQIV